MKDNKISELSIFFPFWNEEENIKKVVTDAVRVAEEISSKWELIMVDDGSVDKTSEIANELAAKSKNLRVVSLLPNRGYGAALRAGFENSRYEYIVFNDGDRQFDFGEVEKFIKKIDDSDIVIGFRRKRRDNFIRHILMNMLKGWDYVFFGFYFKDIDCGFKMFRREALEKIMPLRSEGAMITTEILAKAKIKNLKISQVEVNHYPRLHGDQSGANIPVLIRAILESFILWFDIRNKRI